MKFYVWDNPYLFKYYSIQTVRGCVPDHEIRICCLSIITKPVGGTSREKQSQKRFFSVDFISLPYLEMPTSTIGNALDVNS